MKRLLTVVPPKMPEGHEGPCGTKGTRVLDEKGDWVDGVTKITLEASADYPRWRGTVEVNNISLTPEGVLAEMDVIYKDVSAPILPVIADLLRLHVERTGEKPDSLSVQYDGDLLLSVSVDNTVNNG